MLLTLLIKSTNISHSPKIHIPFSKMCFQDLWDLNPNSFKFCLLSSFPGGSEVKVSACNAGDQGSIPGSERSPGEGNGNPLQYSCLENPTDRGTWWATVHRVDCKESDTIVLTKYSTLDSLEKQNILLFPKYTIFFSSHTLDFVCSEVSSLSIVLVLSH